MRTQLPLSISLLLATLVSSEAGAAIARPELVTPFPEAGVWIDPERPNTFLTFDRSPTLGWQVRLLEFGDDGRSDWTELHGDGELEFGDPNLSRVPGSYALARGTYSRSLGGREPFTNSASFAQLEYTERLSSPDLAFLSRNTAIWDYKNDGGRLLMHDVEGGRRFRPDPDALYWMVVRDHLKTQTGVVRLKQFEDTPFYTLDCLDCWREYGLINTDAVAAGTVLQCEEGLGECVSFQFEPFGTQVAQLALPYLDRFHALSLDEDATRTVEEFWLVPVMPGRFDWKVYETPAEAAPSAPRLPSGVFEGTDLALAIEGGRFRLTGHDEIGQPRWWTAITPLAVAEFFETLSSGRFAMSTEFASARSANFPHRFVTSFDGSVLRLRDSDRRGTGTERTQVLTQIADFDSRPANDIALLSLRNRESELLGKIRVVQEQVLVPNASFERTTLACLDCVQRGARGQRGRGAFELEKLLGRLSWTRSLDGSTTPQIVYRNGSQQFSYSLARDNRYDDQWVLRLVDSDAAAARSPEVPVEIRILPVPGLKEGN